LHLKINEDQSLAIYLPSIQRAPTVPKIVKMTLRASKWRGLVFGPIACWLDRTDDRNMWTPKTIHLKA